MSVELMLDDLSRRLNQCLQSVAVNFPIAVDLKPLQRAAAEIAERTSASNIPAQHRNRIIEALMLLRTRGPEVALSSHLRYVCWALCEPAGTPARRVLDEPQLLPKTFAVLRESYGDALLRPNVWRGLLDAYLRFAPPAESSTGRDNWLLLRALLAETLARLHAEARFRPPWLDRLYEHANLLGDKPYARYGAAVLDPDDPTLAQLRTDLQIPETSWFWSELLLAQVHAAVAGDDSSFVARLDALLQRISERPAIRDRGLATLLDRYAASARHTVHIGLRDTALNAWGTPHLERNQHWGLVNASVKQLVCGWLVIDALETFFKLLGKAADTQRLEFWLKYKNGIDSFHFCLNQQTYDNQSQDYQKFRKKYRELISRFRDAGASGNAFIFRINGYYIVEFGEIGATYVYRENHIPFRLGMKELSTDQLKDKTRMVARFIHNGDWKQRFAHELETLGIIPDKNSRTVHATDSWHDQASTGERRKQAGQSVLQMAHNTSATSRHPDQDALVLWSVADAITHARTNAIGVEDNRSKNDALWIMHDRLSDAFANQLQRLGFKYAQNRGWWKK